MQLGSADYGDMPAYVAVNDWLPSFYCLDFGRLGLDKQLTVW